MAPSINDPPFGCLYISCIAWCWNGVTLIYSSKEDRSPKEKINKIKQEAMSAYMPHAHFRVFGLYESGFMKDTRHVKVLCKWRVKEQRLIGAASRRGCMFLGRDRQTGRQAYRMSGHLLVDKAPPHTFLALKITMFSCLFRSWQMFLHSLSCNYSRFNFSYLVASSPLTYIFTLPSLTARSFICLLNKNRFGSVITCVRAPSCPSDYFKWDRQEHPRDLGP